MTHLHQHKKKVPHGIRFFQWVGKDKNRLYRGLTLLLTFLAYTSYHLSRKPISIVKGSLSGNCTVKPISGLSHLYSKNNYTNISGLTTSCPSWAPFNSSDSKELLGALDLGFLFAYAIGMFVSGYLAEHMDLRIFLSGGMFISGIFTIMFGMGYFLNVHNLAFFLIMQIFAGFFQSSGWPSVVECVGNWFGKGRRGLIMGIWNSHTSVGNIAGSAIAGIWASHQWGYSFIVPGIIIIGMGIIVYLFLVVDPAHIGCSPPHHHVEGSKIIAYVDGPVNPEEAGLLSNHSEGSYADSSSINGSLRGLKKHGEHGADSEAINFWKALLIPGVVEYSLCLFFAKLVSYTFLFWLPFYLEHTKIGGVRYGPESSADLSIFFDVGGILGGIIAGVISDRTNCSGITCVFMLLLGGPMLFIYRFFANSSIGVNTALMTLSGVFVNGPYALITTAVSANLGTHECLQGDTKAMATVTAIIDGTGSFGAALGPLLTGIISPTGWNNVYYMLIAADLGAAIFLTRQVWFELKTILPCLHHRRGTIAVPTIMRPLHYAARYGNEHVMETLIKMGAQTNCKQKYGWRPIHEASMNGKLECLDLLLRCGSHVNAKTGLTVKGMTPLHYAVKHGHLECVKVRIGPEVCLLKWMHEIRSTRTGSFFRPGALERGIIQDHVYEKGQSRGLVGKRILKSLIYVKK